MGLDTFGDVTVDRERTRESFATTLQHIVAEGILADELGIDFIGVGEHHRADFAVSAPEVVLAAIAASTTRIRLGSAVTVMSSDDPVRVFQRFATLDGVSNGRAEVILGRGSFTESFPLFGYELDDYETLSRRRSNCSRCFVASKKSRGGARCVRHSTTRKYFRRRWRGRCQRGSGSGGVPNPWCGRPVTALA